MTEPFDVLAVLDAGCAGLLRQFGQTAVYRQGGVSRDTMALIRPSLSRSTPFGVEYTEAGRVEAKQYLAYILPMAGVAAADMENGKMRIDNVWYDIFDACAHQLGEQPLYFSLLLTRAANQEG